MRYSPLECMSRFAILYNEELERLKVGFGNKDIMLGMLMLAEELHLLDGRNVNHLKSQIRDILSEIEYNKRMEVISE